MRRVQLLLLLITCAFTTQAAAEYPDHPIRMIVPQAAGSATDTLTRVLASALSDELHQQVVVDDRPGGALTLGLDLTAKSPPDGYTLCMGPIGALAITRHLVVPLPYDIQRDFQPIALVARGQLLLAVSPATSFRAGADRLRQTKSGQAPRCLVKQRLAWPCRRRAVQIHDRRRHRPCAL
jgi:tripartite-type tricarboxylate transporter receptor subunit TctC